MKKYKVIGNKLPQEYGGHQYHFYDIGTIVEFVKDVSYDDLIIWEMVDEDETCQEVLQTDLEEIEQ